MNRKRFDDAEGHQQRRSAGASLLAAGVLTTPPDPKQKNASSIKDEAEGFAKSLMPQVQDLRQERDKALLQNAYALFDPVQSRQKNEREQDPTAISADEKTSPARGEIT